jgi:cysteine desulfurase / selenocysteine lyase
MLSDTIRNEFPILGRKVNDKPLVYLDNAATTLKPKTVITAINEYYSNETANVHRGIHYLSALATQKYEESRRKAQKFLNAKIEAEIIFTSGTTAGVNLVARSFATSHLKKGDKIVITQMEHHSNLVPWQMVAQEKGFVLDYIPLNKDGEWDLSSLDKVIDGNTKLVAFNYVSNSLGTINPIEKMIQKAKSVGAYTFVDAAQAVAHFPIDVQKLDCDFLAFSSHKLFGPTGFGVLYGKEQHLQKMPPLFGGGDMIRTVTLKESTWNDLPFKFEAGTPHIAGGIGLGAAIDFVNQIGFSTILKLEHELYEYALAALSKVKGIKLFGTGKNKIPIFSFNIDGIHATDLATFLDQQGIAVRTGHHCTMPALEYFGIHGMARASFSIYNTKTEVDTLVQSIEKAKAFFL